MVLNFQRRSKPMSFSLALNQMNTTFTMSSLIIDIESISYSRCDSGLFSLSQTRNQSTELYEWNS
jgi:hypothetical protein